MKILILLLFCLFPPVVLAGGHIHLERWYQERWCARVGGVVEAVLPDRTRCDCLTAGYAVEVDFARKWAEGIGQAMYYAAMTGRAGAVVLIVESEKDLKYVARARRAAGSSGPAVWIVRPSEFEGQ